MWTSFISGFTALIATGISIWSVSTSRRALKLAELQDLRRKANLAVYLSEGFSKYEEKQRTLSFLISVTNRSDSDDSISRVELQVDYVLANGTVAAVRFPPLPPVVPDGDESGGVPLGCPQNIDAHKTVEGWLLFRYPIEMLEGRQVESYSILVQNSEGFVTALEHATIKEIIIANK